MQIFYFSVVTYLDLFGLIAIIILIFQSAMKVILEIIANILVKIAKMEVFVMQIKLDASVKLDILVFYATILAHK